jgi:hypothetical protein
MAIMDEPYLLSGLGNKACFSPSLPYEEFLVCFEQAN